MQTIRLVDALAVRIVTAADCRSMDTTLEDVGRQISQIEAHLAPNNVQGLKHQVDTLRSQMQVSPSACVSGLRRDQPSRRLWCGWLRSMPRAAVAHVGCRRQLGVAEAVFRVGV